MEWAVAFLIIMSVLVLSGCALYVLLPSLSDVSKPHCPHDPSYDDD